MSPTTISRKKITPAPIPIDMPRFCGSVTSPVVTEKLEVLTLAHQIKHA
jgi:hypothetical protein